EKVKWLAHIGKLRPFGQNEETQAARAGPSGLRCARRSLCREHRGIASRSYLAASETAASRRWLGKRRAPRNTARFCRRHFRIVDCASRASAFRPRSARLRATAAALGARRGPRGGPWAARGAREGQDSLDPA